MKLNKCPDCDGSGYIYERIYDSESNSYISGEMIECTKCSGDGYIYDLGD